MSIKSETTSSTDQQTQLASDQVSSTQATINQASKRMDEIDLLSPTFMSADEAAIPGGIATKEPETVAALDTATITTAVATAAATTIEEQLARLYQRQDDQTQLLSELRSRVIELEGVVQKMKQGGGRTAGVCTIHWNGGGGAERKRSNDEANPPIPNPAAAAVAAAATTTTNTTTHHPSDHHPSSSSLLINNNGANIADRYDSSIMPPATVATDDDEISNILASRRERNLWPLKRKYCTSFSRELDLMKLRFHQSDKYPHKTVRIPKQQSLATATPTTTSASATAETPRRTSAPAVADDTILTTTATSHSYSSSTSLGHEVACSSSSSGSNNNNNSSGNYRYGSLGNKEGRLICRLCSGKTMNRNTSWMCGTCIVPLCIDVVDGNPNSSCFAKWHRCQDLIMENLVLNGELREKRTMKKQRSGGNTNVVIKKAEQESNLPISGEGAVC